MVHYIRFLSPPQALTVQKRTITVSAVIAVTTDLGDSYLVEDADLIVRVVEAQTNQVISEQNVTWKAFSRALKANVQCSGKYSGRSVCVHVTTLTTQSSLDSKKIPSILDVWSSTFALSDRTRSEPIVARKLPLSNGSRLQVWEETGDSIARHVWDASLGFLMYFELVLPSEPSDNASYLQTLVQSSKSKPLQVLELGTGCGTVGIAFAQLLESSVVLTDLEDAMVILRANVKIAKPTASSTLRDEVFDWGAELDDSFSSKYDLILVSDCIYNPDSSVHLVKTLRFLTRCARKALILVGFKRRHDGDDVFFEHMNESRFEVLERHDIHLPHLASDYDAYAPIIEFHVFRASP
ncbi:uncharacterized protein HMPREF1541_06878 [Cyphellophora europaea CBS 101466]|uniref:Uncharacterized protein n=1 Tax=Cyphellophora europaea (strain CBS 101466) TaxID=1220924 RepID=W2RSX1_CYPE1|nr:uncharacterized protein HMPREF1541_06878 [Cyphellophora europaea CBS 101466]ETN38838.1 hypothetical protein HMPREF1541_06878 [Cyphellophora europaea CBS 101466]